MYYFSMQDIIQKDLLNTIYRLAIYSKEGVPLARNSFLEKSDDPSLCFLLTLLLSVRYFSFLHRSLDSSWNAVFYNTS